MYLFLRERKKVAPLLKRFWSNYLNTLTLNQRLRVREDPENHVLYRALLLEDHPSQIQ